MRKYGRKFWLTVVGGLVIIINGLLEANGLPTLDNDTVINFVVMILGFIFAEGAKDAVAAARRPVDPTIPPATIHHDNVIPADVDREV